MIVRRSDVKEHADSDVEHISGRTSQLDADAQVSGLRFKCARRSRGHARPPIHSRRDRTLDVRGEDLCERAITFARQCQSRYLTRAHGNYTAQFTIRVAPMRERLASLVC